MVFKPAEQSPGCGLRVVEALRAGGAPDSALALVPGEGAVFYFALPREGTEDRSGVTDG